MHKNLHRVGGGINCPKLAFLLLSHHTGQGLILGKPQKIIFQCCWDLSTGLATGKPVIQRNLKKRVVKWFYDWFFVLHEH